MKAVKISNKRRQELELIKKQFPNATFNPAYDKRYDVDEFQLMPELTICVERGKYYIGYLPDSILQVSENYDTVELALENEWILKWSKTK